MIDDIIMRYPFMHCTMFDSVCTTFDTLQLRINCLQPGFTVHDVDIEF